MLSLIERKIDEIRRQPESVRFRYVWGLITVIMAIILSVWIMNLRSGFQKGARDEDARTIQESISERWSEEKTGPFPDPGPIR